MSRGSENVGSFCIGGGVRIALGKHTASPLALRAIARPQKIGSQMLPSVFWLSKLGERRPEHAGRSSH
jgi:hypothetical protein